MEIITPASFKWLRVSKSLQDVQFFNLPSLPRVVDQGELLGVSS